MKTHSLYGAKLDSTELGGIIRMSVSQAVNALIQGSNGAVDPTFGGIMSCAPSISLTTLHLAAALDLLGIVGDAPTTSEVGFQENTEFGERNATALSWVKITPYKSLWIPTRLSLAQDREGTLEVQCIAVGDASNAPLAVAMATLSYSQAVSQKFTLGKVTINATDVEAQSLDIDFGISVVTKSHSGLPWPIRAHIVKREPTITVTGHDLSKLVTFKPSGKTGLSVTAFVAYAQKIAEGGDSRVAAATAEHIKFDATQGPAWVEPIGGDHGSDASFSMTFRPVHDGTNAILQIDTTSAIS